MFDKCYPPTAQHSQKAWINRRQYQQMYDQSITNPEQFWAQQAESVLSWDKPWSKVCNFDFKNLKWFEGAKLNVCYNCVDRHLPEHKDKTALIYEEDEPGKAQHISYQTLYHEVCKMANILLQLGVTKGAKVCLYLPMIPEAAYAMLACSRIGAVHSVVFAGFSPKALQERINDADCQWVITADSTTRGGKTIALKNNVDEALSACDRVKHVLVVKNKNTPIHWQDGRDQCYQSLRALANPECPYVPLDAEDPFFILYTSGSTGKPKGVLHTTGGYLLYAAMTFKYVFDYHPEDIFWCTADIGWITGHSYMIYGPLANAATSLLFGGTPNYPSPSRFWDVIDEHQVSIFYTAPTAIRALMREGDRWLQSSQRKSLRILGTVGEPINPEVWHWYHHTVGQGKCPIVDTWWQTETGGILLSPLPGATTLKPGSACDPLFGIKPAIIDDNGNVIEGPGEGRLVFQTPWPAMMRTVYGDHQRFESLYLEEAPGCYFTGDGARRDEDGYYTITGRIDDVINVSGHRLGTAEIESALLEDERVSEAAVVGYPHPIKGQGIYAYVSLKRDVEANETLKAELIHGVRNEIGAIAKPDAIQWAPSLPKTRSGKIMRRILRKIAAEDYQNMGDLTTLAEPNIVDDIIKTRATVNPLA